MNIQQFQYVLAVVDYKNFEAAAERCFVTQSTLSTMIGRLEDEIGIKVFNRKTKPVSMTSEGEQIIGRLRIIMNEIEQLGNMVQELKGEIAGELRIGIIPTIAPYLLSRFLPTFVDKFPKLKTVIKEIPTAQIQIDLKNRSLDVGILATPLEDGELVEQHLYAEPFWLYDCREVKKHKKVSTKDLDYTKLWLLQDGHCLRSQIHRICEQSNKSPRSNLNFEFESGSMDSLLRFTKSNRGMTIIPFLATLDLPVGENVNLVEFTEPTPARSIGLVTHKYFVKKTLLKELQIIIQESVPELIAEVKKIKIIKPV